MIPRTTSRTEGVLAGAIGPDGRVDSDLTAWGEVDLCRTNAAVLTTIVFAWMAEVGETDMPFTLAT